MEWRMQTKVGLCKEDGGADGGGGRDGNGGGSGVEWRMQTKVGLYGGWGWRWWWGREWSGTSRCRWGCVRGLRVEMGVEWRMQIKVGLVV